MIDAEPFNAYRTMLFSIAYRMLGSVMDAEDLVQETFLRWQQVEPGTVQSPKSYLSTVITRLCIDHLRSARIQREQYVGPWLPEPLLTEQNPDAEASTALSETISMAFLVLLESLSPVERAVFLLHDVFEYDFEEVAGVVGKSAAACRQAAHRARQHLRARRPRFRPAPEEQQRLTHSFVQACGSGDLPGLMALLADEITLWSDGGGKVQAARKPIHGAASVARFLLGLLKKAPPEFTIRLESVNAQPAIISLLGDHLHGVTLLDITDGRIRTIHIVANPDKLRHLEGDWRR